MAHALPLPPTARVRRLPPVLAVVAVVALLALPLAPGGGGGAHPADAVSALARRRLTTPVDVYGRGPMRPSARRTTLADIAQAA
ncbi:hypothetical protein ACN6LI_002733, partial [Streptomyces violaceoruber]